MNDRHPWSARAPWHRSRNRWSATTLISDVQRTVRCKLYLCALIEGMGIVRDRKTLAVPRVAIIVRDGTDNRRGQITCAVRTLVEPSPRHDDLAVCPCCDPFLVAEEVPGIVVRDEVRRAPCLAAVERSADRN